MIDIIITLTTSTVGGKISFRSICVKHHSEIIFVGVYRIAHVARLRPVPIGVKAFVDLETTHSGQTVGREVECVIFINKRKKLIPFGIDFVSNIDGRSPAIFCFFGIVNIHSAESARHVRSEIQPFAIGCKPGMSGIVFGTYERQINR